MSVNYVNELVPRRLRTSGQAIYAAVTGGLGASLGCFLGGYIVDVLGVWKLYWIAGIVCLVGFLGYKFFKD